MSAFYDEKKTRLLIPSPSCPDDLNALPPSPSCSQGYNGRDPRWASHLFPDDPILLGITMRHDDAQNCVSLPSPSVRLTSHLSFPSV